MLCNIITKWCQPRFYENELFTSNISIRIFHINKLFNSADGRGLMVEIRRMNEIHK